MKSKFQRDTFHGICYIKYTKKTKHLPGNLRKALKLTYKAIHPGNSKQDAPLALAVLDETTSAAIRSYFSNREDAAGFLSLIHQVFIVYNSKERFNSSNKHGNAAVQGDHKPEFLCAVADWVKEWSTSPNFTLTKQTSHALITTLTASVNRGFIGGRI